MVLPESDFFSHNGFIKWFRKVNPPDMTHLDHISHCETSPGTNWLKRWTYRVCIVDTRHNDIGAIFMRNESGPLRAVHLARHKWPGGLVN